MYTIYAWLKDLIFPRFALETGTCIAQMAARWVVCIVLDPCCLWFYLFGNIHCLYTITITKHSGPGSSWQFSVKTWRSNWYIVRESGTAFWALCFFFLFLFLWKSVSDTYDTLLSHFHFVVIHNHHFQSDLDYRAFWTNQLLLSCMLLVMLGHRNTILYKSTCLCHICLGKLNSLFKELLEMAASIRTTKTYRDFVPLQQNSDFI